MISSGEHVISAGPERETLNQNLSVLLMISIDIRDKLW